MKKNKKDILNTLKGGDTGFSIPENYFDQFEKDLYENKGKVKSGFTTPEKYFDAFDDKMLDRLESKSNRSTGFKTPTNYFKDLDQKILSNVDLEKPVKVIKLNTSKYLRILGFTIAASLLLFFSIRNSNTNDKVFDIETLEISEIESWMDEDLITFSNYDISETFDDVYLSGDGNYTEDEIVDYLDGVNIENLIIDN